MNAQTTTAVTMLFALFVLWLVVVTVAIVAHIAESGGFAKFLGSNHYKEPRTSQAALGGFAKRADAVVQNIQEQYGFFAAAVILNLVVFGLDGGTDALAMWSTVYVGARVVHSLVYWAGISLLRTASWAAAAIANVMLFLQLL